MKSNFLILFAIVFVTSPINALPTCESNLSSRDSIRDFSDEASERIFNGEVHKVIIMTSRDTDAAVLDEGKNPDFKRYGRLNKFCFYQKNDDQVPDFCIKNVGYRVRGNQSRSREKRQFKIKFDAKDLFQGNLVPWVRKHKLGKGDRKLYGLSAINLRSGGISTNDPSMIREPLASWIFDNITANSEHGGLVYRVAYVKLYLQYCDDDTLQCAEPEYRGLYYLTDSIDEEMVKSRFGIKEQGALFSPAFAPIDKMFNFNLDAFSSKSYISEFFEIDKNSKAMLALKGKLKSQFEFCANLLKGTPEHSSQYLFMCAHIKKFDEISSSGVASEKLDSLFDLDSFMSYMVAANITGHWDSLISNSNNDNLFFNPSLGGPYGGKWQILAWDLDLTFGVLSEETSHNSPVQFKKSFPNRIFQTILNDPVLCARYLQIYQQHLKTLSFSQMQSKASELKNVVLQSTSGAEVVSPPELPPSDAEFEKVKSYLSARQSSVEAASPSLSCRQK